MSDSTTELLLRLLDHDAELEVALGAQWQAVRDRLLVLLERVDVEGVTRTLRGEVDALLATLLESDAAGLTQQLVAESGSAADVTIVRGPGVLRVEPTAGALATAGSTDGVVQVPVFFGTDRAIDDQAPPQRRFTAERGALAFGLAHVTVPARKVLGELPQPKWWKLEFRPDPQRHVVLHDIDSFDREGFVGKLGEALADADDSDVLLYVHGYNVAFADAALRTAQIAHDLGFRGRTVLFSWPSKAQTLAYTADEATVEWSTPHFEAFLRLLLTDVGARTVHLLSHSMGNRLVTRALERLDPATLPPGSARLRQIMFAAPDVDRDVFLQLAQHFPGRAERFTLYASRRDLALKASKLLHRGPRAGDGGADVVVVNGIDTIEASDADTSLFGLGHSYYGDRRSILGDIQALLTHGSEPRRRFALSEVSSSIGPYWMVLP